MAGLAASGVLTSALRLITKAAFESSKDGLRIGASKSEFCQTFADLVTSIFLFENFNTFWRFQNKTIWILKQMWGIEKDDQKHEIILGVDMCILGFFSL